MENKTCKTCIDNEDGFCDRKGILVEDEGGCNKHREEGTEWKEENLGAK